MSSGGGEINSVACFISLNVKNDFPLDVVPLIIAVNGCCSCNDMTTTDCSCDRRDAFIAVFIYATVFIYIIYSSCFYNVRNSQLLIATNLLQTGLSHSCMKIQPALHMTPVRFESWILEVVVANRKDNIK